MLLCSKLLIYVIFEKEYVFMEKVMGEFFIIFYIV